jgi:hypothetical protein
LALLVTLGTLASTTFGQRLPEAARGPSVASHAPLAGKPGDYAGWQTCAGCHTAEAESFAKTPHAAAGEASPSTATPPTRVTGCETCHGPGKAHADAEGEAAGEPAKEKAGTKLIFAFKGNPKENSERCMTCHITSQQQETFAHSQRMPRGPFGERSQRSEQGQPKFGPGSFLPGAAASRNGALAAQ